MDIFRFHTKKIDKELDKAEGVDAGEHGKEWDQTFAPAQRMSQADFSRPKKPPQEKKNDRKR